MRKPVAGGIAKNRVVAGKLLIDQAALGSEFSAAAAAVMTELSHAMEAVEAGYITYGDFEIIDGPDGAKVTGFRGLPLIYEQAEDFLWNVQNGEGFIGTVTPLCDIIALRKPTPADP